MKRIKYKTSVAILIVIASLACILACLIVVHIFRPGEEAVVGIFSLAATLIGTIFIAVELKNSSEVTCSEMLIDLNNYFHDSDRLMKVYEILERCDTDKKYDDTYWQDVSCVDVAQYCTFFENLFLLHRHHIASIDDLDDLFGYRFFIFMNNPYIQEHYIFPTSSSYAQIFELYLVWIRHRRQENSGVKGWQRHIPCSDFIIPDEYLSEKMYLFDNGTDAYNSLIDTFESGGHRFEMRQLGFDSIQGILCLQEDVVGGLENKSMYFPLSRAELLESVQLDYVAGIFNGNSELIAFAVIVTNRKGPRNLAADIERKDSQCYTFDAVVTASDWRGFGFQQRFIDWAVRLAKENNVRRILATVDPDNAVSRNNFIAKNFAVIATKVKYGGLKRDILELEM